MSEPQRLSVAISELIARRGLVRVKGNAQLAAAWKKSAGDRIAERTKVLGLQRGNLEIGVANSALLNELVSFQRADLLEKMQAEYPGNTIKDIRFKLRSDIAK